MEILILLIGIALIVYSIYKWGTLTYDYWKLRNVKFPKTSWLFGNSGEFMRAKQSLINYSILLYQAYPSEKVFGIFELRKPVLIVRDPNVLKQLTIKDFDYFENHRTFLDERGDILFGNSLFLMRSEKWRQMRANLSPAFTSSKMRQMYDMVQDTAYEMVEHLKRKTGDGQELHAEMKDLFAKYTNDVIASAAFGIVVNSLEDANNEFLVTGTKMLNFRKKKIMGKMLLYRFAPNVYRYFGCQFLDRSASTFFKTMVLDTMKIRTERNIYRPDMIDILMRLKKGKPVEDADAKDDCVQDGFSTVKETSLGMEKVTRTWTDDELIAQCFLFFLAGFDTSSTTLMFAVYELIRNPNAQERLYAEVAEMNRQIGGKRLQYDELHRMQYMDQVFSETLRMWPPAPILDRECVKDYRYQDDDGNQFTINKGVVIMGTIYSYHHDPQYFPNPEQFDPDRFSEESKHRIQAGTYLPFGSGPRNCIGSRFALMELKAVMYYLVLNFKFVPNARTQIPLKFDKHPFSIKTERGLDVQLVPRL